MAPLVISTPLPADCDRHNAILAVLHDHEAFIKLTCPQLISRALSSGDPGTTAIYDITDKKPIGQTTYKLHLTNKSDGIETLADAKGPVGSMKVSSKWLVLPGSLQEDVEIEANMVTKKMVKSNVEKSHPEHAKAILEKAGVVFKQDGLSNQRGMTWISRPEDVTEYGYRGAP